MTVKKDDNGKWHADLRPNGSTGKRYRKQFETKAEALRWEAWIKTHKTKQKEWEPEKADNRTLKQLVERWWEVHGKTLKSGKNSKGILMMICKQLENPIAKDFTPGMFAKYRSDRINAGTKKSTINNHRLLIYNVFSTLEQLDEWSHGNPLSKLKPIKAEDPKTRYLEQHEIDELLTALKAVTRSHAYYIALICLATGARWGEAEALDRQQITPTHITFWNTKGKRNRTVPITSELYNAIPKREGKLFRNGLDTFKRITQKLSYSIPEGQLTHILRHTFASHFMMKGGNVKTLQEILGHSNIKDTMRYTHLAPSQLELARTLNPIAQLDNLWTDQNANDKQPPETLTQSTTYK